MPTRLGRGRHREVWATFDVDSQTWVAEEVCGHYLNCTRNPLSRYLIKPVADATHKIELGVPSADPDIVMTREMYVDYDIRIATQLFASAFEMTFDDVFSPDGIQSVVVPTDRYRLKRIDYDEPAPKLDYDIYNPMRLLEYNLYWSHPAVVDRRKTVSEYFAEVARKYGLVVNETVVNPMYISKELFLERSVKRIFYTDESNAFRPTYESDESFHDTTEVDWMRFDIAYNKTWAIIYDLMTQLEEKVFSKQAWYTRYIDEKYANTIRKAQNEVLMPI